MAEAEGIRDHRAALRIKPHLAQTFKLSTASSWRLSESARPLVLLDELHYRGLSVRRELDYNGTTTLFAALTPYGSCRKPGRALMIALVQPMPTLVATATTPEPDFTPTYASAGSRFGSFRKSHLGALQ